VGAGATSVAAVRGRDLARIAEPAALACLMAAAFALRAGTLGSRLWMDEAISVGIASHAPAAIPGVLRLDGSPPLYYLLLHAWMGVAGRSEPAVHMLSLLVAVLCVPAAWWAARPSPTGARGGSRRCSRRARRSSPGMPTMRSSRPGRPRPDRGSRPGP
jgi:hypothetical protein